MSYIIDIQTAVPKYKHAQETLSNFYQNSIDDILVKRKIKKVSSSAAIDFRYSVLNDFSLEPEQFTFFPKNKYLLPEPSIDIRMMHYKQNACHLSLEAIRKIKNFDSIKDSISHIITVTCTGLSAPGLDIEIIKELELSDTIQRSSINFMGCNAAVLALKQANDICNSRTEATVLIVCTELSTLHFQKNYSDDYITSSALFGDGSAAMIVSSQMSTSYDNHNVKVQSFHSALLLSGVNDMAWRVTDKGFVINLTSYVSKLINGNIKKLLDRIAISPNTIDYWAIHPGGKKILDDFRAALNLTDEKLKSSYDILRNYGNMSSPTILFVLKDVLELNKTPHIGERIFTAAFGPGLSIETMVLEYV